MLAQVLQLEDIHHLLITSLCELHLGKQVAFFLMFLLQMDRRVFEESGNTFRTATGVGKRPSGFFQRLLGI